MTKCFWSFSLRRSFVLCIQHTNWFMRDKGSWVTHIKKKLWRQCAVLNTGLNFFKNDLYLKCPFKGYSCLSGNRLLLFTMFTTACVCTYAHLAYTSDRQYTFKPFLDTVCCYPKGCCLFTSARFFGRSIISVDHCRSIIIKCFLISEMQCKTSVSFIAINSYIWNLKSKLWMWPMLMLMRTLALSFFT